MSEKTFPELPACPPEWANYAAQDADGAWWAYEAHPNEMHHGWYENEVGRIKRLGHTTPPEDFRSTLLQLRPSTAT